MRRIRGAVPRLGAGERVGVGGLGSGGDEVLSRRAGVVGDVRVWVRAFLFAGATLPLHPGQGAQRPPGPPAPGFASMRPMDDVGA